MFAYLGIISGLLAFIADIPYMLDTIKGKTRPHRVTWGIFFLLNLTFFISQLAAGAKGSLGLTGGFVVATFIIFILSIKHGVGGTQRSDMIVVFLSVTGIALWQLLDEPGLSIAANIFAAFVAGLPTIKKAWREPETETTITWALGSVSALLSVFSEEEATFVILMLPVYSVLFQLSVFLIIVRKKLPFFNEKNQK